MNGHRWPEDEIDKHIMGLVDKNQELRELVREMIPFVQGAWCEKSVPDGIRVWPDWDKAQEILSRPEVREIMGEG